MSAVYNNKWTVLILSLCFLLSSCSVSYSATSFNKEAEIESLHYDYGSYHGGYWSYDITMENDIVLLNAKGSNGVELLVVDKEIPKVSLNELNDILWEYHWIDHDGFNKSNEDVLDGYSFHLKVTYKDGKELNVRGYEYEPPNYEAAHGALAEHLLTLSENI